MLSGTDLEKLWFLYKMEGEPRNVSIERFCELNGVPAEVFTKWLKKRERRIERVEVEGMPQALEGTHNDDQQTEHTREKTIKTVDIALQDGTVVSKRDISYQELKAWVEKLEVLC